MELKIAVITGTRAEYGLLYWIMKGIKSSKILKLQIIATGMHLSPYFGSTYKLIENDGFVIDKKVDMLVANDTPTAVSKSIGLGTIGFAQAYDELKPDLVMVLGDRYELLSAVSAAIPFNIPVAHIHGGESTEGAIDEQIRHALTKISHLHFASTQQYADNIVRMGEESWRVHNVGAPGLDWINKIDCYTKKQVENKLDISFDKGIILSTFHPVTVEQENTEYYIDNIIQALMDTKLQIIFTGSNSDPSGLIINQKTKKAAQLSSSIRYYDNLGQRLYLSCQKYSRLMVGNSSSGIIEAASFGLPVINIGIRQKGRLQSGNVIDTGYSVEDISRGIQIALSETFKNSIAGIKNIYGDGNTAEKIIGILENIDLLKLRIKRLAYD